LFVVALVCLPGLSTYPNAQRSSVKQAWEYRVDLVPPKTLSSPDDPTQQAAIQNLLSQRGAEGWELAGMGNYYYFKRPK
jgi:hypothetical protein